MCHHIYLDVRVVALFDGEIFLMLRFKRRKKYIIFQDHERRKLTHTIFYFSWKTILTEITDYTYYDVPYF